MPLLIILVVLALIALPAWLLTFFVSWGFWKCVLAVITARLIVGSVK